MRYLFLLIVFLSYNLAFAQNKKSKAKKELTITNLYDAFGKSINGLKKDFGFSALIKYNGVNILFDAGNDAAVFKNNVEKLGINLAEIDIAIGSHAHGDHLNGFDYLLKINPTVKIYLPADMSIGSPFNLGIEGKRKDILDSIPVEMQYFEGNEEEMKKKSKPSGRFWNANTVYIRNDTMLSDGIKLISTRSANMGMAGKISENDEIIFVGLREISLALSTEDGEIIFTGCSHSTPEKIVEETIAFTKNEIALLYGGFHLIPSQENEISKTIDKLKNELKVKKVAPAHCTGHLAFKMFKDAYLKNYLFAGLGEKIIIE